jgi:hypothetical protein
MSFVPMVRPVCQREKATAACSLNQLAAGHSGDPSTDTECIQGLTLKAKDGTEIKWRARKARALRNSTEQRLLGFADLDGLHSTFGFLSGFKSDRANLGYRRGWWSASCQRWCISSWACPARHKIRLTTRKLFGGLHWPSRRRTRGVSWTAPK